MEESREQQITLGEYLRIIQRGKWIIVQCFLVVFAATVYYTYTAQPIYEASAMVMIKDDAGIKRQLFQMTNPMQQESRINNQVEILKSLTLAEIVMDSLQSSPYADSLWIFGKRQRPDHFSIQKLLKPIIQLIKLKSTNEATDPPSITEVAAAFRKDLISVVPKRNTDMIELKVRAASPFEAAFITNTWMKVYEVKDREDSRGEATEVRSFLENKLKDVKDTLSSAENSLKDYKEKNKVAELPAETEQMIKQLADFETLYQAAKTDLEANEKRLTYLKSRLTESQRALVE